MIFAPHRLCSSPHKISLQRPLHCTTKSCVDKGTHARDNCILRHFSVFTNCHFNNYRLYYQPNNPLYFPEVFFSSINLPFYACFNDFLLSHNSLCLPSNLFCILCNTYKSCNNVCRFSSFASKTKTSET